MGNFTNPLYLGLKAKEGQWVQQAYLIEVEVILMEALFRLENIATKI